MAATGIIDRTKIEDALTGFKTAFDSAFARASTITSEIATVIQSDSPQETYQWFGSVPKMREWSGDRRFDELRAYAQTIVNKDWANGIRVAINDIRDDKLGMLMPRINSLADEAAYHQEELLMNLLVKGFAGTEGLAYDSQFFFDTDHSDGGSASQSNKGTTALGADGVAYNAAWESLLGRVDENGEPIRVTAPMTLIVGPKLRSIAMGLLEADTISTGGTNLNKGTAKLVVSQRLVGTYDDYWFLIGTGSGGMKPLILQQREPVEFIAQDDPSSEGYINRKEARYGANWRGNVGYGLWQLAYGAIVA